MSRSRRVLIGCALVVASWVVGAVFVRLSLDAVDSTPLTATSEMLYIVIAITAVVIAVGGSVASLLWVRRR